MALENKLGITESSELANVEEKLTKLKALELFESGYLNTLEAGTFDSLSNFFITASKSMGSSGTDDFFLEKNNTLPTFL